MWSYIKYQDQFIAYDSISSYTVMCISDRKKGKNNILVYILNKDDFNLTQYVSACIFFCPKGDLKKNNEVKDN